MPGDLVLSLYSFRQDITGRLIWGRHNANACSNCLLGKTCAHSEAQNKTEGNKRHIGLISNVKRGSRERKPRFFMASSPYFLVSFITMVITDPMSVSLWKYEFQEGSGLCILLSVELPASSFRNRFPSSLQPGPARVTQPSETALTIPFIILFIIPFRVST